MRVAFSCSERRDSCRTKRSLVWEKRAPAAGGGCREPAFTAAVEKPEEERKPERFFANRKAARSEEARGSNPALRPLLEGKAIAFYPLLAYFGNFFGNVIFWPCAKVNKKGKQFSEKGIFLPSTGHEKAAPFGAAVVGVLIIFSFLSGMRSRSFSKALRRHVR